MERPPSYTLIGLFSAGALALIFIFVAFLRSESFFNKRIKAILYFEDSVNGLEPGAPVKLKGVPIGEVKKIFVRFNQADASLHVPVLIEIETQAFEVIASSERAPQPGIEAYIKRGLYGKLDLISIITGMLYVELDYAATALTTVPIQIGRTYPEIPTQRSPLSNISQDLATAIGSLSRVDFHAIGHEAQQFLAQMNASIEAAQIEALSQALIRAAQSVQKSLGSEGIEKSFAHANQFFKSAQALSDQLESKAEPLSDAIVETAQQFNRTLQDIQTLSRQLEFMTEPHSPHRDQLLKTLRDISHAAQSIALLTDFLERNPNALIFGRTPH